MMSMRKLRAQNSQMWKNKGCREEANGNCCERVGICSANINTKHNTDARAASTGAASSVCVDVEYSRSIDSAMHIQTAHVHWAAKNTDCRVLSSTADDACWVTSS